MTSLTWHRRTYTVDTVATLYGKQIVLTVSGVRHSEVVDNENAALRWLTSHSLRKGKARELLKAENRQMAESH